MSIHESKQYLKAITLSGYKYKSRNGDLCTFTRKGYPEQVIPLALLQPREIALTATKIGHIVRKHNSNKSLLSKIKDILR